MPKWFVYSTLTNSHRYTNWTRPADVNKYPEVESEVLIEGGANLATSKQFTPIGVRTEITDEQHEQLHRNKVFLRHLEKKLILVFSDKEDPEVVARRDMQAKDRSAPITPEDAMFKRATTEDTDPIKPAGFVDKIKGVFS